MSRALSTLLLALMLGGCATTSGTAYYYDGDGDYYYDDPSPGMVVHSSGSALGVGGYGYGYAGSLGYGFGYGYPFGYGYGFGGFGSLYSPWYFGYPPYVVWPLPADVDPTDGRELRAERERALRASLVHRPTVKGPLSADFDRAQPFGRSHPSTSGSRSGASLRTKPSATRSSRFGGTLAPRSTAPAMTSMPTRSAPPPMRVAPPPARSASRKQ